MRWRRIIPLSVFAVVAIFMAIGLTLDPKHIPSALLDKPVPAFDLPPLPGQTKGFSTADLPADEPVLVNVFASWCVPCRAEHPLLMDLAKSGVKIYGLNHKDSKGAEFLAELGNPYVATGDDRQGRASIEWGVYGVPETFIVHRGRIICKQIGPLMPHDVQDRVTPALADLKSFGRTAMCPGR